MDLTSLSSTLPNNPTHGHRNTTPRSAQDDFPPALLMSAFKQAALSVTNLYKTANAEIESSRKLGYQECLEDLLNLLESGKIQQNSETTKIREWVLSKSRSGGSGPSQHNEQHTEESEDDKTRSRTTEPSSPMHSGPQPPPQQQTYRTQSIPPSSPIHPLPTVIPVTTPPSPPPLTMQKESNPPFSFRSNYLLPQHPPPPPTIPSEDIDLTDPASETPVTTPTEQQQNFFNTPPPQSRSTSGAWKRRFPYEYDFLELAATAEREKEWINGKRGRLG